MAEHLNSQPHPIDLIIIGTQKAGTSSLQQYLSQHPQICCSTQREIGYFVNDEDYNLGYKKQFRHYFNCSIKNKHILLAKSVWIMTMPKAITRLKQHNPNAHLIIVLRNPIDRAYSSYWYAKQRGGEERQSFEDAISIPVIPTNKKFLEWDLRYLEAGRYIEYINYLTKHFTKKQLHFFLLEDIQADAVNVCQRIFHLFDNISSCFKPNTIKQFNKTATYRIKWLAQLTSTRSYMQGTKSVIRATLPQYITNHSRNFLRLLNKKDLEIPPMAFETRVQLLEYYKPYNDALSTFLQRDLSHWDK